MDEASELRRTGNGLWTGHGRFETVEVLDLLLLWLFERLRSFSNARVRSSPGESVKPLDDEGLEDPRTGIEGLERGDVQDEEGLDEARAGIAGLDNGDETQGSVAKAFCTVGLGAKSVGFEEVLETSFELVSMPMTFETEELVLSTRFRLFAAGDLTSISFAWTRGDEGLDSLVGN